MEFLECDVLSVGTDDHFVRDIVACELPLVCPIETHAREERRVVASGLEQDPVARRAPRQARHSAIGAAVLRRHDVAHFPAFSRYPSQPQEHLVAHLSAAIHQAASGNERDAPPIWTPGGVCVLIGPRSESHRCRPSAAPKCNLPYGTSETVIPCSESEPSAIR